MAFSSRFGRVFGPASIAGLLAVAGCSKEVKPADAGEAVASFHQRLDAGDYGAIWGDAAPELRASVQEATFGRFLAATHGRLGKSGASEETRRALNTTTTGTYTTVIMHTRFGAGEADENFVFKRDGGRVLLAGYHIQLRRPAQEMGIRAPARKPR